MKFVKLGNIVKISSGGTPLTSKSEYYNNGNIPWVKTGDLKVRHLINIPDKITQLGLENSSAKLFPINTVLIAMYGATIGACSILKTEAASNQACAALLPNDEIDHEFLYFYLLSIRGELVKKGVGGGQPNISATILKSVDIPIFNFEDQIHIATILSKVETLIKQRKESIALLDEFLKSTFLKMFGDPFKNPMNWEVKKFGDVIDNIIYGTSTPPVYENEGIPFIRATNIKKGRVSDKSMLFISEFEAQKIEKCKLDLGDMIIVRSGANTGDAASIPLKYKGSYGAFDLIIKINPISSLFYNELINSEYGRTIIKPLTQRAAQPHINSEQIKNLNFYYPPYELQTKFAYIIEKTETIKTQYQQSLKELEGLFGSLSQKAFKGELDLSKCIKKSEL
jgi:type I restriction enzyme S subunit